MTTPEPTTSIESSNSQPVGESVPMTDEQKFFLTFTDGF